MVVPPHTPVVRCRIYLANVNGEIESGRLSRADGGLTAREIEQIAGSLDDLFSVVRRMPVAVDGPSVSGMMVLAQLNRTGGQRISELSSFVAIKQPAMTHLVNQMEAAGLVCRRRDPVDRRVVNVAITDGGRQMLARRVGERQRFLAGLLSGLSEEQCRALLAAAPAMKRMAEGARRHG